MNPHIFDQRSWRLIKDFAGIYGIKMAYTKIKNLSRDKLSKAYFEDAKLTLEAFGFSFKQQLMYDRYGYRITTSMPPPHLTSMQNYLGKSAKEWKVCILSHVGRGYKNKEFYEAVAKLVAPSPKETCICGLKMGASHKQQYRHYQSKSHINRMLQCVPVKDVADTIPKPHPLLKQGNPHLICLSKIVSSPYYYRDYKIIDLLPLMKARETDEAWIAANISCDDMLGDEFLSCFGVTGRGWELDG
jgi:hypothetical protein